MSKTKQKASGNGSKRKFIVFIVMLIILALCGFSGYLLYRMSKMNSSPQIKDNASLNSKKSTPPKAPIYIQMDTFTVSLKPVENDSDRVLYIGLTLRLKDENAKALVQQYMPEVRSRLLVLFSQQTATELTTDAGKFALTKKIKDVISLPLVEQHSIAVDDVLFNAFIIR